MPSILTIEDNPFFARVYKAVLTSIGCRTLQSGTVGGALDLLMFEQPDLVIVDVRLADGSGLEVIRSMRANPRYRETPIITITTGGNDAAEQAAFEAGTTAFLAKPVNIDELKALVQRFVVQAGG
jgi:CheY-like chemotaxis protein